MLIQLTSETRSAGPPLRSGLLFARGAAEGLNFLVSPKFQNGRQRPGVAEPAGGRLFLREIPAWEAPSGHPVLDPRQAQNLKASTPHPSQGSSAFQVLFPPSGMPSLLWPGSNLTFSSQLGCCFPGTLP